MTTLNNEQKIELTKQLAEVLSYEDEDRNDPQDLAYEVVDSWLPIYYYEIAQTWMEADRPNVEDTGLLDPKRLGDVYHVMQVALYEQGSAWIWELWDCYTEEDVTTAGQALTACNVYLAVKGENTYLQDGRRAGRVVTL